MYSKTFCRDGIFPHAPSGSACPWGPFKSGIARTFGGKFLAVGRIIHLTTTRFFPPSLYLSLFWDIFFFFLSCLKKKEKQFIDKNTDAVYCMMNIYIKCLSIYQSDMNCVVIAYMNHIPWRVRAFRHVGV